MQEDKFGTEIKGVRLAQLYNRYLGSVFRVQLCIKKILAFKKKKKSYSNTESVLCTEVTDQVLTSLALKEMSSSWLPQTK